VLLAVALGALALASIASLCIGAHAIAPREVLDAFVRFGGSDDQLTVRHYRLPRTVLGIAVGAALGVAGALMQTTTRNPLADPGLVGTTAGAGFAITLGAWYGHAGTQHAQLVLAAAGAAIASVLVYAVGRTDPLRLLLSGVALSAVLSGIATGLRLLDPTVLDAVRHWAVGSLAGRERTPFGILVGVLLVALVAAVLLARPLDVVALGGDVSRSLGVNVVAVRTGVLVVVAVLTATATSIAGPIAFVGLLVPHLARMGAGSSTPWLVGLSAVLGPTVLVASDVIARVALSHTELPVGVVTAFVGGPALIWAVRRFGVEAA